MPRFGFYPIDDFVDFTNCILCGTDICSNLELPWLHIYRTLYIASDEVKLSGVGFTECCGNHGLKVPMDQNARWDTMADNYILLTKSKCWPWDLFLFHEVCWQHFIEHFEPRKIELSKLYETLKRLPVPQDPMFVYGHVVYPFETPSLRELLQPRIEFPSPSPEVATKVNTTNNPTDCFQYLPLEIREVIALFSSPAYWKSRFELNRERGFLNYLTKQPATEKRGQEIDWRLLYHSTRKPRCRRTFEVTINVWEIFRWLRDALLTREVSPEMPLLEFGGKALQHYHNTYKRGTHIERVSIPPSLVKIGISVVTEDDIKSHITGLEFISEGRPSVTIGYKNPEAEIITEEDANSRMLYEATQRLTEANPWFLYFSYRYPGAHILLDARQLRGFAFDCNSDGVHRIMLLRETNNSLVAGMNEYGGIQHYTIGMNNVMEVVGTFDEEKMVHLGIRGLGNRQEKNWELNDRLKFC